MNTSTIYIEPIKQRLLDSIQHKYLEKYIQKPIIDEEKLIILSSLINNIQSLSSATKERYIITTMMVQIALDTHEKVPVETTTIETEEEKIANQLKVLAGDYYSGLYYLLLSEIEDFELIRRLASGIKEINEYKMKMHYQEFSSFDDYINTIKNIETQLIFKVAEYVNDQTLNIISGDWLVLNKFKREKRELLNNNPSPIMKQYERFFVEHSNPSLTIQMDSLIQNYNQTIEGLLDNLPVQHTAFKLHVNAKLTKPMYINTSNAEEG